MTFSSHSTFEEVVDHYNRIKPLGGKDNVGKDIRPIGDRRRKYERIVKISANCYALSDGYHFGDEHFQYWGHYGTPPTSHSMEKYAPIVWRKLPDGTDQVTIRNGWGPGTHNGRYAFLDRHSPRSMTFCLGGGKQYMRVSSFGGLRNSGRPTTTHYLAKVRTTPKSAYDDYKLRSSSGYYAKHMAKFVTLRDDNSAVVFRRKDGSEWEHVEGTGGKPPTPPRVDKKTKAKFKVDIQKFFEWGMTVSPLLMLEERNYAHDMLGEMVKHFQVRLPAGSTGESSVRYREIVRNEDHPMRLQFWVQFASSCTDNTWSWTKEYYVKTVETKEDLAKVRSRYNTFINAELGFINK
jgi:hypothetical protein